MTTEERETLPQGIVEDIANEHGQEIADEITVALDWHDTLKESPRFGEVMAYADRAGALPIAAADAIVDLVHKGLDS
jgi:hypothetical protein